MSMLISAMITLGILEYLTSATFFFFGQLTISYTRSIHPNRDSSGLD